ncbi:MAG: hypothetical protein QW561_03420 [Candidatus Aenigmatarchaeota archaeon]
MAYDETKPVTGGPLIAAEIRENFRALKDDMIVNADKVDGFHASSLGIPPFNGSFENDVDGDGIPDGWSRFLWPGGSAGFETTNPVHGAKAYYFTHPGGEGNGGGYLWSDFIEVTPRNRYMVTFIHWATAANMKNQISIRYYNKNKSFLFEDIVYNSTENPTSPGWFLRPFIPPQNARYIKVAVVGGNVDTNVAGTAYFDNVVISNAYIYNHFRWTEVTEKQTNSTSYVDVGSVDLYDIPDGVTIRFSAELKAGAYTAYMRWRIGSSYSNEVSTSSLEYVTFDFALTPKGANTGALVNLVMQLKTSNGDYAAYGKKVGLNRITIVEY